MDDITNAIAGLTDRIIAKRVCIEKGYIIVGRLDEKLRQASTAVGRLSAKIEARADAIIAREAVIEQRTQDAFAPHEAMLAETEKGLDGVEHQLALLTNEAPLKVR